MEWLRAMKIQSRVVLCAGGIAAVGALMGLWANQIALHTKTAPIEIETAGVLGALVVGLFVGAGLGNSIVRPLRRLKRTLSSFETGQSDGDMEDVHSDELSDVADVVRRLMDRTHDHEAVARSIALGELELGALERHGGDPLSRNLMQAVETIRRLIAEMESMSRQHDAGDIDVVIDATAFSGVYRSMAAGINAMVNGHITVKKKAMACIEEFGRGNFAAELESFPGKKAFINETIERLRTNLKQVHSEIGRLAESGLQGRLSARANEDAFDGDWANLMRALNRLVSAIVEPIEEASGVLKEVSQGNLSVEVAGAYQGDHALIKSALNQTIASIRGLIREMERMSREHDAGDIDVVIDESKFSGAFLDVATGVNRMVNGHITVKKKAMACIEQFAKGNFHATLEQFPGKKAFINATVEELRGNLQRVNTEIRTLIVASQEGRLSQRASAEGLTGDWAELVRGLNGLVGAIIEPIEEAATVMEQMSQGNLDVRVKGDYKGDHAKIKHSLNDTLGSLSGYVDEIARVLSEMAQGNLRVGVTGDFRGDFSAIKSAINGIVQALNRTLFEIHATAEQVATTARQVSESAQDISRGSTEQASSVEELTATMEQISVQTKLNSDSAGQAHEFAIGAKNSASDGNAQMKEMLKAMNDMNDASNSISKIIKVIDEIAFQTNILALNAAVEAARAGQHGKGFAVVAEEVRNLAARSADAAKETTNLIESSIQKVEYGSKIAQDTADALESIVVGVNDVAALVGKIAMASGEQATGISQVNLGINQVSQVIQMNSATSEEGAAASEQLSAQAETLKQMVGRFNLNGAGMESDDLPRDMVRMFDRMRSEKSKSDGELKASKAMYPSLVGDFGKY